MKKWIALLLVCAISLLLFAGCSKTDTAAQNQNTEASAETQTDTTADEIETEQADTQAAEAAGTASQSAAQEPSSADGAQASAEVQAQANEPAEEVQEVSYFPLEETGTITCFYIYPPMFEGYAENGPADFALYQRAEERLNVHLEFDAVAIPAASERFSLMIAGGEYPDAFFNFEGNYTGSLDSAVEDEILIDLTDYIAEYAPDYDAARSASTTRELSSVTAGGNMVTMYGFNSVEGRYPKTGTVIRQDWLDKLGMELPETIDEWETVLTAFKDEMGCTAAYALPADGVTYPGISGVYGPAGTYQIDGQLLSGITDTDAYHQLLTLIYSWYRSGIVYSDFIADETSKSSVRPDPSSVASGDVGIWTAQASDLDSYTELIEEDGADVVGIPGAVLHTGDTLHTGLESDSAASNMGVSVSSGCLNPELVVRYFNYFFTDEGDLLAYYGIEGETFTYVDGVPAFMELVTNNPDGMSFDQAQWLLVAGSTEGPYVFDHTKYASTYSQRQLNAGEMWVSNIEGDWDLPASVNNMLTEAELEEYNSLNTDIETYMEECAFKFIMGQMDVETEWDTYVDALVNTFHYDRCLELVQAGLTRYLSK